MGIERQWFYLDGTTRVGPIPDVRLRGQLRDGSLPSDSPVWTEGMTDWQPASVALPMHGPASQSDSIDAPVFYPVSTLKFAIMSLLTWSLYDVYWAYRNWKYVKDTTGVKISPFWRAWFVLFFNYDLYRRIKEGTSSRAYVTWSAGWLTLAYLLLLLSGRLPDPLWMVSLVSFVPVLPVVGSIKDANGPQSGALRANSRFTGWDICGAVVGGLLYLLTIAGYLSSI